MLWLDEMSCSKQWIITNRAALASLTKVHNGTAGVITKEELLERYNKKRKADQGT
jgi:hypothetical protein